MLPLKESDFLIQPSPIQEIVNPLFQQKNIQLFVKRDDQIHPNISGNKWRKLKHNLLEASKLSYQKLMTFGGAFSNHLAATAAAGQVFGFETLGIIRGERVEPLNPTLQYVESCGMHLKFVSRSNYRLKQDADFFELIEFDASDYFVIPQGGSNCLALTGIAEVIPELEAQLGQLPDYICTACGTGATMAGLTKGLEGKSKVLGFPVLKGDFMTSAVNDLLNQCTDHNYVNWQIFNDYHFGGYAKYQPKLLEFMHSFEKDFNIPLDPIYTAKMAYGVFDLMEKGYFQEGSTIVLLHTGGLQGVQGFQERYGVRW